MWRRRVRTEDVIASICSSTVWKPLPRGPRPSIEAMPIAPDVLASEPPPMSGASDAPRPAARAASA